MASRPLAGGWIEIGIYITPTDIKVVPPLAGGWIEIPPPSKRRIRDRSRPSRAGGLKL